jgi:hypothetical protein
VIDWDAVEDDDLWEIDEDDLVLVLACWDRLVTPDMAAGARLEDLQESDWHWATGKDASGDPPNSDLPPDDLFAAYAADDPNVTPLGLLLYGIESTPG